MVRHRAAVMGRARGRSCWTQLALLCVSCCCATGHGGDTRESELLHGDAHPPVAITISSLVLRGAAVELSFGVVGTIPGFVYKIQASLRHEEHVQERTQMLTSEELSSVVRFEFASCFFGATVDAEIRVLDAMAGLTAEQALVGLVRSRKKAMQLQAGPQRPSEPWQTCGARTAVGHVDNKDLPIGENIAILLVGKTRYLTSMSALDTLKRHVLARLPDAHVFVHASAAPWGGAAGEIREAQQVYQSAFSPETLRAVIITPDNYGHEALLLATRLEPNNHTVHSPAETPRAMHKLYEPVDQAARRANLQFARLRDLMLRVLREERILCRRYSHVVRMRTDMLWLEVHTHTLWCCSWQVCRSQLWHALFPVPRCTRVF